MTVEAKLWWMIYALRASIALDWGKLATEIPIPEERNPTTRRSNAGAPDDGVVRIFREKGGRGGKVVTVIRGLPSHALSEAAAELRRVCGAGGTVKEAAVEIQGDQREKVGLYLQEQGYRTKLAGG